jgi:hypothetical protein
MYMRNEATTSPKKETKSVRLAPSPFLSLGSPFSRDLCVSLVTVHKERKRGKHTLVVDQELVQAVASGDHGEDGDLLVDDDLEEGGALGGEQPLELVLELLDLGHAVRLDVHGLRELDEVCVALVRVREAVLVEERLPLRDHALLLVVEDDDLDADVELCGGGELRQGHGEGGVAVDVDDEGVGARDLGADGGGQAVAHGAEASGGDHGAWVRPAEVLRRPHLVLAHTCRDDRLVLDGLGELAQLLDDGLRLDESVWPLLLIRPREAGFPVLDLGEPFRALLDLVYERDQLLQVGDDVALDGLGSLHNLVDVLRHDLEVDDSTSALCRSRLRLGCELGQTASRGHRSAHRARESDRPPASPCLRTQSRACPTCAATFRRARRTRLGPGGWS